MKVLIVDDHQLFAESVRCALEARGLEVSGIASGASEAVEMSSRTSPDVVLMDVVLPDGDGIDAGRTVLERQPETTIVAMSSLSDQDTVTDAFSAGFSAFVRKDCSLAHLVDRIESAADDVVAPRRSASGTVPVGRDYAAMLMRTLTKREREILGFIADGASGPIIATELGLSRNTVRTHVQNILTKLQVTSRLEAAAFAVQNGYVAALHRARSRASA